MAFWTVDFADKIHREKSAGGDVLGLCLFSRKQTQWCLKTKGVPASRDTRTPIQ
jgi:hypothetical protein